MTMKPLKKILLAEDEPDIRAIMKIALEDIGQFTVKICSSGKEALESAEAFSPDLIVLDVMMPDMDGVHVFKEFQKKSVFKNIPVIFVTAKAQASEIDYYHQLGVFDVIVKPFDPVTLSEELRTLWKKHYGS